MFRIRKIKIHAKLLVLKILRVWKSHNVPLQLNRKVLLHDKFLTDFCEWKMILPLEEKVEKKIAYSKEKRFFALIRRYKLRCISARFFDNVGERACTVYKEVSIEKQRFWTSVRAVAANSNRAILATRCFISGYFPAMYSRRVFFLEKLIK